MNTTQKEVKIFCPATVANVNCGFDALGFALEGIGDEMAFKKVTKPGVTITKITGPDTLPLAWQENVAGVAALAMLKGEKVDFGIEIEIHKKIRCGSGIGSSAASAAGAVFGVNQFLDKPISKLELTRYAMKGEALASGTEHADNVAPCIYGGTTLITSYAPFHIVALPPMDGLYVGIIHPHIKISTKEARKILPSQVSLANALGQAQKLAGFVASLYEWDKVLFATSLKDMIIEPYRKELLPHFEEIKQRSQDAGCIAFGISGSGPSMFTFAFAKADIALFLKRASDFYQSKNIKADTYNTLISGAGCQVLS